MPMYLDRHDLTGSSARDVAAAHVDDLAIQDRFGVRYLTYWFDYDRQHAFCLADGPDREAVMAVHREGHGGVATDIVEVDAGDVARFLGAPPEHPPGEAYVESAFRTILFTDMVGSTRLTQELGDGGAMSVLRDHDRIVRTAIEGRGGTVVKHTGDGMMASFRSVTAALEAAVAIQRDLATRNERADRAVVVRIGLAAGEPVEEADDLFGAAVQLAARLCDRAASSSILVSAAVRDLAIGKRFSFHKRGRLTLKGFDEPVRLFEVDWHVPAPSAEADAGTAQPGQPSRDP
jgi:class 3 adenylate cyclase